LLTLRGQENLPSGLQNPLDSQRYICILYAHANRCAPAVRSFTIRTQQKRTCPRRAIVPTWPTCRPAPDSAPTCGHPRWAPFAAGIVGGQLPAVPHFAFCILQSAIPLTRPPLCPLFPLCFNCRPAPRESPRLSCPARVTPRELRGTVVVQCPRQNPMFSGRRAKTLFHRSGIFFRASKRAATEDDCPNGNRPQGGSVPPCPQIAAWLPQGRRAQCGSGRFETRRYKFSSPGVSPEY
jgi:hypothetical protein